MQITPQLKKYKSLYKRTAKMFGKRFKQLREEEHITLQDFADILGISRQSLVYYTMGDRIPRTQILISISAIFNVSVDYLLGLTDTKNIL